MNFTGGRRLRGWIRTGTEGRPIQRETFIQAAVTVCPLPDKLGMRTGRFRAGNRRPLQDCRHGAVADCGPLASPLSFLPCNYSKCSLCLKHSGSDTHFWAFRIHCLIFLLSPFYVNSRQRKGKRRDRNCLPASKTC